MRRAWHIVEFATVALLIAMGFFALARVWAAVAHAEQSTKDFWDIATAVGTCAAVLGAIWIANSETRRRNVFALDVARLTAAGIMFRIGTTCPELSDLCRTVAVARGAPSDDELSKILIRLRNLNLCSRDEMKDLIPLPERCAYSIAGAIDRISVAVSFLHNQVESSLSSNESRLFTLDIVGTIIAEAHDLLLRAIEICEQQTHGLNNDLDIWRRDHHGESAEKIFE